MEQLSRWLWFEVLHKNVFPIFQLESSHLKVLLGLTDRLSRWFNHWAGRVVLVAARGSFYYLMDLLTGLHECRVALHYWETILQGLTASEQRN